VADAGGAAYALIELGFVSYFQGDYQAARTFEQQALGLYQAQDAITARHAWLVLGHTHLAQGQPDQAVQAYQQALQIHRNLGPKHKGIEPLAGLARVALAQENITQALIYAKELYEHIKDDVPIEGVWEPLRHYLTCYQVLCAADDPRAERVLDIAYERLQEWAARTEDEAMRCSFLENVAVNREIMALWQKQLDKTKE
jgi:tetratricopeptide (TPR) repeat protein